MKDTTGLLSLKIILILLFIFQSNSILLAQGEKTDIRFLKEAGPNTVDTKTIIIEPVEEGKGFGKSDRFVCYLTNDKKTYFKIVNSHNNKNNVEWYLSIEESKKILSIIGNQKLEDVFQVRVFKHNPFEEKTPCIISPLRAKKFKHPKKEVTWPILNTGLGLGLGAIATVVFQSQANTKYKSYINNTCNCEANKNELNQAKGFAVASILSLPIGFIISNSLNKRWVNKRKNRFKDLSQ